MMLNQFRSPWSFGDNSSCKQIDLLKTFCVCEDFNGDHSVAVCLFDLIPERVKASVNCIDQFE